ncbi:MAG: 4'-phosphopantetheinyl transferase superfamily protein [Vicingaceae bacterium]|nr:4'-phosphopantetheinyl transferase superfamily protein [Vicingaceae bacterium]
MPVYRHKNVTKNIKLGIWYINETSEELTKIATEKGVSLKDLPEVKNKNRINQWIATRLLLKHFFLDTSIIYDEKGKPSLNNGWNISISHSGDYVAIILNKKNHCGIDVEKISDKVERIKHKFLNETDLKSITTEEGLTIYWGAKEALYKYYGKKEVLFIENLFIEDFSPAKNTFKGIIEMPHIKIQLNMAWEKIEDYILVYTTNPYLRINAKPHL